MDITDRNPSGNGKLSQLKRKEKALFSQRLYERTRDFYSRNKSFPGVSDIPGLLQSILMSPELSVFAVSYEELEALYHKEWSSIHKKVRKDFHLKEPRRKETVAFTNMCLIEDGDGMIVAMEKKSGHFTGVTLPGGHREENETFSDSVAREVWEETGLTVINPRLCGLYHWEKNGVHHCIFLYYANNFTGTLKSSSEGEVYWTALKEYKSKSLAYGVEQVLKIILESKNECYMRLEEGYFKEILK